MNERHFVVDFSTVKRYWLDGVEEKVTVKQNNLRSKFTTWARQIKNGERSGDRPCWEGGTATEMKENFRNGYKSKQKQTVKFAKPTEGDAKTVWAEEGDELDLHKMWGGDPTPFSSKQNPPSKPGLRIVVDYSMSCGTKPEILEQFGSYIAALTEAFSRSGYDLDVDARITVSGLCVGESGKDVTHVNIRLKKMGVKTDYAAWSPMFAPSGFRMAGFTAMYLAGDDIGKQVPSGLGMPCSPNNGWGARWDDKTRTMHLDSPNTAYSFDADAITEGVRATGLLN